MKLSTCFDLSSFARQLTQRRDLLPEFSRIYQTLTVLLVILAAIIFQTPAIANTKLAGRAPGNPQRNTIATGNVHTCQVRPDGTSQCWGANSFGQLGDGTLTNRTLPVTVTGLTDATSVVGGILYTCALRATGTVQCWGLNSAGQLGQQQHDE